MSIDGKSKTVERKSLTARVTWKALQSHYEKTRGLHLRQLFADDPKRGERMTVEGVGLFLDYSKSRITQETLPLLVTLAEDCGLRGRIDAMFRGEKINITENRSVLHMALRRPARRRSWWMATMSCRRSMRCSTR